MRKITERKNSDKKKKRNQIIIGIVLVFVMLASTFEIVINSFGGNSATGEKTYGDFKFVESNGYWITQAGDNQFIFRYLPDEAGNFTINKTINDYYGKPLYIQSDSDEATLEIYRNLGYFVQRVQEACYGQCDKDVPIKNCDENFLIIQESNYTNVQAAGNCIFIEGKKEELTKLTDDFLFDVLGIQ